jgi:regulator of sirC expression with transglutaminase-like and TPR domain
MLNNLKAIYLKGRAWDKALGIVERILLLDPGNPRERRDRGWVLVELGELRRGVADLEAYLGQRPEAPDAEWVRTRLRRVRQSLAALN